jgi:transposase InsO family protein
MPFGEANAPATFVQLMNQLVLKDFVHSFANVFMDDILISSESPEEHLNHVQKVLSQLQRHGLFLKPSKCTWMVDEVDFLGHHIKATPTGTEVSPSSDKLEAVRNWPRPTNVKELRSFLGFANYYRDHVRNFSKLAVPLYGLTSGNETDKVKTLNWSEQHEKSFEALKDALCSAQALAVPDDNRQFILNTDASDFAVGAVLSQCDDQGKMKPVGFMSHKLSNAQLNWSTYEKELYAVLCALNHWSMHLWGTSHPIVVYSDHHSLEHLLRQPKLTAKQSRWIDFLSQYNIVMKYMKGELNIAADALSRRPDHDDGAEVRSTARTDYTKEKFREAQENFARTPTLNVAMSSIDATVVLENIRGAYERDEFAKKLLSDPGRYGYTLNGGLLMRHKDNGIFVPNDAEIRTSLISEAHDPATSGHLGINKTFDRLAEDFYWPGQRADVTEFVVSCTKCQANKSENKKTAGLMQPIEPPGQKGEIITLDFIGPLPRSARGKDCILVMVDKFTKRVFYEATKTTATARDVANIVFNRIVRHQGLPIAVISDRDARFTGNFWRSLWDMFGTKLSFSTAYHPQSDGQTERQNRTLEESLRSYVNQRGSDWDKFLVQLEIAYNSSVHASTGYTPFRLDGGIDVRLPLNLVSMSVNSTDNVSFDEFLERFERTGVLASRNIETAQNRQTAYVNRGRRETIYNVGDLVWLNTENLIIPGIRKLRARFTGPFEVIGVNGDLNVTLKLPDEWKVHNTFHVDRVKKHNTNNEAKFPTRDALNPILEIVESSDAETSSVDRDELNESDETSVEIPTIRCSARLQKPENQYYYGSR